MRRSGRSRDALEPGFDGIFLMEHDGGDSLGNCATNQRYLRPLLPAPTAH